MTVGRLDRMNLFFSSSNKQYYLYDNSFKKVVNEGKFIGVPFDAQGSVDGRTAYIVFRDSPKITIFNLKSQELKYIQATHNGAGAYTVGLTNNVYH